MISAVPFIGAITSWWTYRFERNELQGLEKKFSELIGRAAKSNDLSLTKRTVQLLEQCKEVGTLKREVAALERTYFTYLVRQQKTTPLAYRTSENRELAAKFGKMGIRQKFLLLNPEFLVTARKFFWQHYFPFVKMPIQVHENVVYFPVETSENAKKFTWRSWSDIKSLNFENFRITHRGFAVGHADQSRHMVPLKTVKTAGKCALQFVTTCPIGRSLPSSIDFKESGHSFTQVILTNRGSREGEVYSVGFYPRKLDDLGYQFFKTVPGVYRNHDTNVSRIQAGQAVPIVKQYVFKDDKNNNPCLYAIVKNMIPIAKAMRERGKEFIPITLKQIERAMLERNEPELDRILIRLTEIRELIIGGQLKVPFQPMTKQEKAQTVIGRFEAGQGQHLYNVIGANCTAVSYREEAFAFSFLDAELDQEKPIVVYDSQVDIRDHKVGILDWIHDIFDRIFLHFFVALPLTGPLLGTGSLHPDARSLKGRAKSIFPSVLSEMAHATHEMLVTAFEVRPVFPAGEILARSSPVVEPPSTWARIQYLWKRHLLLGR